MVAYYDQNWVKIFLLLTRIICLVGKWNNTYLSIVTLGLDFLKSVICVKKTQKVSGKICCCSTDDILWSNDFLFSNLHIQIDIHKTFRMTFNGIVSPKARKPHLFASKNNSD